MYSKVFHVLHRAGRWLGGLEVLVLVGMLLVLGGVFLFVELADEVQEGSTQDFDERILLALRNPDNLADPIGPEWVEEIGRDLTAYGGIAGLTLLTLSVVGYLLICRAYHAMWLVIIATFGGMLLSTGLKQFFDRPRPNIVPHMAQIHTASFPSGHSMLSAVVYLTLGALLARLVQGMKLRIYVLCVALMLTGIIGASRVYLGVHYPSDVLAGWVVGLVWSIGCWLVARALQRRGKVERTAKEPETA